MDPGRRIRRHPHAGLACAAFCLLAGALVACHAPEPPAPSVLRVSALPDAAPELVRLQHGRLVEEVCALASIGCVWVDAPSYDGLVAALGRGAIDLAYLGGVTFVQARQRHGAIPLVLRDVDLAFTSAVVVRSDAPARSLGDLRGSRFAFGNESSTSGGLMPWYFLEREGLDPAQAFSSVVFSGRHDATIRMVAQGEVAAGAVNASIFLRLVAAGEPSAVRLRVLWRSPPFTDYVWAVRKELPAALRQRLLNAFLDLDRSVPGHREALRREDAGGFLPASAEEWDTLTSMVARRGRM